MGLWSVQKPPPPDAKPTKGLSKFRPMIATQGAVEIAAGQGRTLIG